MEKKINNLSERTPVIAVMGHIDHGKSTLLDYIRKTNVTEKESGGITQHISAYEATYTTATGIKKQLTFLDTPGHEAFSALRARGAAIADIAVLVVAAEEGVKPQTKEAYQEIKEAGIPFIVAINKVDKPEADIEKTKMSLAENEVYVEGFGGTIPFVSISGKTGQGVPELLDMIFLVAELEELTGNPSIPAEGIVLENELDPRKGSTATLVIKNGTLESGSFVASDGAYAPVRIMENFKGEKIEKASFSSPVRIIGWNTLPPVGALFKTFLSKNEAQEYAEGQNKVEIKNKKEESEDLRFVIPVIIEADTSGSLEALTKKIEVLQNERAKMKVIRAGIGAVSESDIKSAISHPNAIVFGFRTKIDSGAKDLAERSGITVETFDVIYGLLERIEEVLKEKTPKITVEEIIGTLKVLKTFSAEKNKYIVGGRVETGSIKTGTEVKIIRRGVEIGVGSIREMQKLKNRISEATEGEECGITIESKIEPATGDLLHSVIFVEK
ncbi:MAG: translation initiation factor IF-2 [Patescibacteria group bacterium]|nr:translation initiation factor IF-2 [bacterium]MDZ4240748.1 translation initiation factor IF-2 [Patescibacteria group bacterium]